MPLDRTAKRPRGVYALDTASSSSISEWDGGKRARLDVVSRQETTVRALSAKLEWRIDQFDKLMKLFRNGQNIISNQFSCERAAECVWELHVYPNGKREEDAGYVSFFLRQVGLETGTEPIMTEFQIYCLDSNMQRVSVCRDTKDFTHQQGRGKFQVTREKMQQAIRTEGDIVLVCDVEYFAPGSKLVVEERGAASSDRWWAPTGEKTAPEMGTMQLLRNKMFTDTVIKIGEEELHVHRCMLALHSSVFNQMFDNEHMMEAQDGVVRIDDAPYSAVRALVEYVYAPSMADDVVVEEEEEEGETEQENHQQSSPFNLGRAINLDTQHILAIADKYDVGPLKHRCEQVLAVRLTPNNVCEMLLFGDTYSCQYLKRACVTQLREEHTVVLATDEWKALKTDHPGLANQLLESIVSGHDIANVLLPGTSASVRVVNEGGRPRAEVKQEIRVDSAPPSSSTSRRNPPRARKAAARKP